MNSFKFEIKDALINGNSDKCFSLEIKQGEQWYLLLKAGSNISGLFDWLAGKLNFAVGQISLTLNNEQYQGHYYAMKFVELVRFRTSDNESAKFYYQQRYHATENEGVVTLRDYLGNTGPRDEKLVAAFDLTALLDEAVNMLSTGEFKKACIVKASMKKPLIMFIEEPYAGIDAQGRGKIDNLLQSLANSGMSIVIASSGKYIPEFVSRVFDFENSISCKRTDYKPVYSKFFVENIDLEFKFPEPEPEEFVNAFMLQNATVKYDDHAILHDISWGVKKNEKWALTGRNGSGKSTLLSLVFADNPQVYSNEVYVFDKQRGTGESIWEIKEKIGFYSSELHRYFNKLLTLNEAIVLSISGNPYKRKQADKQQQQFIDKLLELFQLDDCRERHLYELSTVQQKLVLLIGIFAKNPPLLILDEPFQGFDNELVWKCRKLIDMYCVNRTLVFVSHVPEEIPGCVDRKFEL